MLDSIQVSRNRQINIISLALLLSFTWVQMKRWTLRGNTLLLKWNEHETEMDQQRQKDKRISIDFDKEQSRQSSKSDIVLWWWGRQMEVIRESLSSNLSIILHQGSIQIKQWCQKQGWSNLQSESSEKGVTKALFASTSLFPLKDNPIEASVNTTTHFHSLSFDFGVDFVWNHRLLI